MACSLTIPQVRARSKLETRRSWYTWTNLEPGDRLLLIEKGMGLRAGEKQVPLAVVEIAAVECQRLRDITQEQVAAEGFPEMTPAEFIAFWMDGHGLRFGGPGVRNVVSRDFVVRRIVWRYIEGSTVAT